MPGYSLIASLLSPSSSTSPSSSVSLSLFPHSSQLLSAWALSHTSVILISHVHHYVIYLIYITSYLVVAIVHCLSLASTSADLLSSREQTCSSRRSGGIGRSGRTGLRGWSMRLHVAGVGDGMEMETLSPLRGRESRPSQTRVGQGRLLFLSFARTVLELSKATPHTP